MIKGNNLTKQYKNEIVFKDLNFHIPQGKFTLIKGPSGSGKTTLLNIISTIDNPKAGKLFIKNEEITNLSEHQKAKFRAKHIGFIFQSYALIPEFSILENCIIPLIDYKLSQKEMLQKAKEAIQQFIPEADEQFLKKTPTQLSGGQQQRISIARALIHNPDIIIADEPTANLDDEASKYVKNTLKELVEKKNKTIIVVSHENDYLNYADVLYEFVRSDENGVKSKFLDEEKAKEKIKQSKKRNNV